MFNVQISEALRLDEYLWKNRVLLIFKAGNDLAARRMAEEIEKYRDQLVERDVVVIEVEEQAQLALAREELVPDLSTDQEQSEFQVVLIGKDGDVKLSANKALALKDVFALIDSMPLRKLEIINQAKNAANIH